MADARGHSLWGKTPSMCPSSAYRLQMTLQIELIENAFMVAMDTLFFARAID